jgi:D-alanyl-D-alanine dipeptidase
MASIVIGWPEISGYVGSRREMEEWTSVPIGSPWDRMKPLGSHTTSEQTNRRQEQEFKKAMKGGGFAGLGKER